MDDIHFCLYSLFLESNLVCVISCDCIREKENLLLKKYTRLSTFSPYIYDDLMQCVSP